MKYLILPFIILLSSCRLDSNVNTEYKEPPETVEEYCEDYSSHLVEGSKKDNSYQGCITNYSYDFEKE